MDEKSTPSQPTRKILRTDFGLIVSLDDAAQTITLSDALGVNLMTVKVQTGDDRDQERRPRRARSAADQHGQGAAHPAVFGDQLLTYLNQLVTMFNAHMHPGEMARGLPPGHAGAAGPPFPPATPSLISTKNLVE